MEGVVLVTMKTRACEDLPPVAQAPKPSAPGKAGLPLEQRVTPLVVYVGVASVASWVWKALGETWHVSAAKAGDREKEVSVVAAARGKSVFFIGGEFLGLNGPSREVERGLPSVNRSPSFHCSCLAVVVFLLECDLTLIV